MDTYDERVALCALNKIFGYHPRLGLDLLNESGSALELFSVNGPVNRPGVPGHPELAEQLNEKSLEWAFKELSRIREKGFLFLSIKDDGYPAAKTAEDDRSTYPAAVNLDLYEWQPSWTVKVWENGVEGVCYPVDRVDFDYRDLCDNGTEPYEKYSWLSAVRSLHNIQYQPSALGSTVTFKVYDDSGSLKYSIDNIIVK